MKILEINKFNFVKGGADKHFLDLVKLLESNGHEVAVFSMDHPQNQFSSWKKYFVSYVGFGFQDSWKDKIKGLGRIYSWEARRKVKKLIKDFQPDIVHIHNIYHHISPSILSAIKKKKIPIVMTVHDYNLICPNYLLTSQNQSWENIDLKNLIRFIGKKGFKNSYLKSAMAVLEFSLNKFLNIYDKNIDLYIAPSQFTRDKLVAAGIRADKIVVQPHFLFNLPNNPAGESLSFKERYAFYFGSISSEKGIHKLIRIFNNLPNIKLYLAGNIDNNFKFRESEKIKYLGFLSGPELEKYIKNSLFVVSPSVLPETFGLIALEAIKNGKPFVGFNNNAYREIIENDRQGYLCGNDQDFREKLRKLAEDEGLRILFSRNAVEHAKNFDSQNYHDHIIKLFQNILDNKEANPVLTITALNDKLLS